MYHMNTTSINLFPHMQTTILKLTIKMKLQSQSNGKTQNCEQIFNNLERIADMISQPPSQSLQLSVSVRSDQKNGEMIGLARQFVSILNNPYKTILLYPRVVDSNCYFPEDSLFQQTTFPPELHSILSLYLHKCSNYPLLQTQGRRIVDLFYCFLIQEHPKQFKQWTLSKRDQSLGEWFFNECIAGFFQLIYKQKEQFTVFICFFLQHGLPYLFESAAQSLSNNVPPQPDLLFLEKVRLCYIVPFQKKQNDTQYS